MITQKNLVLTRPATDGQGGLQFIYRVKDYGIAAVSPVNEDITMIQWRMDVIKFENAETLKHEICHTTDLADKTLTFRNDPSMNEFLEKAFVYFEELHTLENMMNK